METVSDEERAQSLAGEMSQCGTSIFLRRELEEKNQEKGTDCFERILRSE
jgi:hypothetical protein